MGAGALLGRENELAALDDALAGLAAGRGAVFTVTGEAGIGKTRLLDAAVQRATATRARSAWGRCWESGGAPSFWPWTQVIRTLVREDAEWLAPLPELRRLLPELAEPAEDSEGARFALFDAVARGLRSAGAEQPLVLALDDLHAADAASLLLTAFVAEQIADVPLLLLCAFREAEAAGRPELISLARRSRRLALTGLDPEALGLLVAAHPGEADPQLVAALHESTAGKPFFAAEVWRALPAARTADAPLPLPDSVRETILARAQGLSPEARATLDAASVIGQEFRLATLAEVRGAGTATLVEHFAEAVHARLAETDRREAGRYRLAHALVREALYDVLPEAERLRLHAAVGHALIAVYPDEVERHTAELAHHFGIAAAVGEAGLALEFAIRAGKRSLEMLAYEQAVVHFSRALRTLHLVRGEERRRGALLLDLGGAQMRAGDIAAARATFREAAEVARNDGDAMALARAALGLGVWGLGAGDVDPTVVHLAEEALEQLGDREPELRARLLARLASALQWGPEAERRADVAAQAVALAETIGDPDTTAFVFAHALSATWSPATLSERHHRSLEMRELARAASDRELELHAQFILLPTLIERGDGAATWQEIGRLEKLIDVIHQRRVSWQLPAYRAMQASIEGRWKDYEASAAEVSAAGEEVPIASVLYYGQRFVTLANQGRADELTPVFSSLSDEHPGVPVYRCALALAQLDGGDPERARATLRLLAGDGFASVPFDHTWLTCLALLSEVAARLEERGPAEALSGCLAPWADHHVVTTSAQYYGPVARFLGVALIAAGRPADGLATLAQARDEAARMGALPNLVHIALGEAAAHAALGDSGAAASAAAEAAARAEELDIPRVGARAAAWAESGAAIAPAPAGKEENGAVLRREGDVWTLGWAGRVVRLPDAKGLQHLAVLLANPGVEIHSAELASMTAASTVGVGSAIEAGLGVRSAGSDDAGPLLDAEAKSAYRARVEELREEIEEAESFNDPERAASAREELDFIARELSGAVGLGGRDRKAAATSERARVNVTRASRTVIKRVGEHDAELGDELERTVRTGTFCAYAPDPRHPVRWTVHSG